ncbi:MAG: T9SS type A sorting domain-containing protein [Ferruginibacter sp.]
MTAFENLKKRSFLLIVLTCLCQFQVKAQNDDDPDLPTLNTNISKEEYLSKREKHISDLRGNQFLNQNTYNARAIAIEAKWNQERAQQTNSSLMILAPNWTQLGPSPIPNGQTSPSVAVSGRTTAIAIHPTNPNLVYVGTANGGVYRTTDGGSTWLAIFDAAQSLSIGALALAPSNPSILYVGTGEPNLSADSYVGVGLYRIDNADASPVLNGPINPPISGTTCFFGRSISKILVDPANAAVVYVSTATGVIGNPNGNPGGGTIPPLARRGIYRSTNATAAAGSVSFTKLDITAVNDNFSIIDMVMNPGNSDMIVCYLYASGGGIYMTNNASAATPVFTHPYTTATAVRGELAITKTGPVITMYCANGENSTGRILKSIDGGLTWPIAAGTTGYCSGQCFYDIAIECDPTNANNVYVGGASGTNIFRRSTDGLATVPTSSTTNLHADCHVIKCAPSSPLTLYLGCDGGIWRSTDGGINWTSRNTAGFHATQFQSIALHPIDPKFTIGGTQDNGTNKINPDATHTRIDAGDGGYALIDQNAVDNTNVTLYHTYYNLTNSQIGVARQTVLGGAWTFFGCGGTANGIACTDGTLFYSPMALGPGSPNTLYFGTDRLYRSVNQGTTMTLVSQGPIIANAPISSISIARADDNVRLVGLTNGKVYTTSTGSTTLNDVTPAAAGSFPVGRVMIDPIDKKTAYICYGGYGLLANRHIWKTTNLNAITPTWVASGVGIPDIPVNAFAIDQGNTNILVAGTDIGVYVSIDAGASWNSYSTGLPVVPVFDMAIHPVTKALRIATHGRGFWETTNPIIPVEYTGFYATAKSNARVLLEWFTASESNNKGFTVERAAYNADNSQLKFENIGFVNGSGTTSLPKRYAFDDAPLGGKKFVYRLKQVNLDGIFKYSESRVVTLFGFDYALYDMQPNPVSSNAVIKYQLPVDDNINISIYNIEGKLVKTVISGFKQAGIYQESLNFKDYPPGNYIYKMTSGSFYNSKKIVVIH